MIDEMDKLAKKLNIATCIYGFSRLLLKIFNIGIMKMNNKGNKRNVFLSSPPKVNTFSFDIASTIHTNNK